MKGMKGMSGCVAKSCSEGILAALRGDHEALPVHEEGLAYIELGVRILDIIFSKRCGNYKWGIKLYQNRM